MAERERAREGERECDGKCDGEEGENSSAPRSRRKECRFAVESKTFEIVVDDRKGKIQILIMEKKGGVSSWVRLGPESLGFFLEGLNLCIKDEKEARWGREWKEQGRMYTMTRGINRAGGFIRLGVSDLERKRFCIFIPRGRRDKRGWTIMAEKLHQLVGILGRKPENQEVKAMGKAVVGRSYATIAKWPLSGKPNAIVVKAKREETIGLLQKLECCVVASWKNSSGGEDLEKLGQFWAKSWDLRGNLGLAKLEKERVLLEFEELEEARRVVSSGNRSMGGVQVGLEFWNPRSGCWAEEEERKEVWVRIVGLPISLWNPVILKRVGDECGGYIIVDEQTKTMGELQWARILVKSRGECRPSVLEIEVEEEIYVMSLWWECRPVLRRNRRQETGRQNMEVRGEGASRTKQRVEEERVSVRLETLN